MNKQPLDPYKTLGVTFAATEEEVKKAYRAKAIETHPDKNLGDSGQKFREVCEAYEVLSDKQKRAEYDQAIFARNPFPFTRSGVSNYSDEPEEFEWERRQKARKAPVQGFATVNLSVADTLEPHTKEIEFQLRKPCLHCMGGMKSIACVPCDGVGYRVVAHTATANIPRGVRDGDILVVESSVGVVHAKVVLTYSSKLRREKNGKLIQKVEIPYPVAVLGGSFSVTTFAQKSIAVKLPPLESLDNLVMLSGMGCYPNQHDTKRENLFLELSIQLPTKPISNEHKTLLEQLVSIDTKDKDKNNE